MQAQHIGRFLAQQLFTSPARRRTELIFHVASVKGIRSLLLRPYMHAAAQSGKGAN